MKRTTFAAVLLASAAALPASGQSLESLEVPGLDPASGEAPQQLVFLIHGYTQSGEAMRPLAESLAERLPDAAFIFPDAPLEASRGRSWYNFSGDDAESTRNAAVEGVHELVSRLSQTYSIEHDDVAIAGFSQGGGVAINAATCAEPDFAIGVSLAGVIYAACDAEDGGEAAELVFVHNLNDPTVEVARGAAGVDIVRDAGYEAELETFDGDAHWPADDGLARARDAIVAALSGDM